jgi:hypothetical protein
MNELLTEWRWTARKANVAHLRATDSLSWRNFVLGGASAVLGALVGLGVFANLQSGHLSLGIKLAAGGAAFAAAASAALWKYLDYGTRIEQHRNASREYGNMVRWIDQILQTQSDTVETIRKAMDDIDRAAPNVSPATWVWAVDGVIKERANATVDATTIDRGVTSRLLRLFKRIFG